MIYRKGIMQKHPALVIIFVHRIFLHRSLIYWKKVLEEDGHVRVNYMWQRNMENFYHLSCFDINPNAVLDKTELPIFEAEKRTLTVIGWIGTVKILLCYSEIISLPLVLTVMYFTCFYSWLYFTVWIILDVTSRF